MCNWKSVKWRNVNIRISVSTVFNISFQMEEFAISDTDLSACTTLVVVPEPCSISNCSFHNYIIFGSLPFVIFTGICLPYWTHRGTRWRNWLRHCATSRKVAGSIPDGVIAYFHWHNPSDRTMALGSTQPLTEISTRNISWEWRQPVLRADNLTTFMCRLSYNLWASTSWNPQGLSRSVMGLLYLFIEHTTLHFICK
jgi:hypothetical protein